MTTGKKDKNSGCSAYRQEMILAGLRRRLRNEELSPEQHHNLRREIAELEKKLGLEE